MDDGKGSVVEEELIALLPRLRRMARALCRDDQEADDLVQTACERALANRHRFHDGTRLDSWLYRIMQNHWLDLCRRRRTRGVTAPLDGQIELAGADGRRDTESRLTLAAVRRLIRELPEDQRLALVLVTLEGLSYREAAERMEVPLGTLMSRLGRARRKLMELVEGGAAPVPAGGGSPVR